MKVYIIISFMVFSLISCTKVSLYEPNKYKINSYEYINGVDLTKQFTICSSHFSKEIDIIYKANLLCSKIRKKAIFIDKTYFYSCYFSQPVANNYVCQ